MSDENMPSPAFSLTRTVTLPYPLRATREALLSEKTVKEITLLPDIAHSYQHTSTTRTHVVPAALTSINGPYDMKTPLVIPTSPTEAGDATTVSFTFAETVLGGWVKPFLEARWTFPDRQMKDGTWVGLYHAEVKSRGVRVRKVRLLRGWRCGETGEEETEVEEKVWV